jgi:plasmid segregation protein ParM
MIISVDHGNKSIKTPNTLFTSGLISSEGLQGFKTDYICWNGRYYTLTEQRISYLRDKTEDERFYVLTLFAIAKELERRKAAETLDPIDITLLIGLPPAHYEQLHSRFEQYFLRRREAIDFEYNGKYYSIRISKVLSYPQAFAAAVRSRPILLPTSSTLAALPLTFSSCVTDVLTWRWSKVLKRGSSPSTTALRASAMRSMPGS